MERRRFPITVHNVAVTQEHLKKNKKALQDVGVDVFLESSCTVHVDGGLLSNSSSTFTCSSTLLAMSGFIASCIGSLRAAFCFRYLQKLIRACDCGSADIHKAYIHLYIPQYSIFS